mmetsp:Transcript_4659/g.9103  ORF Transcript_4659/g.9103 Transcript_4659/m.9103 type:complete len:145 (-) Transcript_4659:70-504(-)
MFLSFDSFLMTLSTTSTNAKVSDNNSVIEPLAATEVLGFPAAGALPLMMSVPKQDNNLDSMSSKNRKVSSGCSSDDLPVRVGVDWSCSLPSSVKSPCSSASSSDIKSRTKTSTSSIDLNIVRSSTESGRTDVSLRGVQFFSNNN